MTADRLDEQAEARIREACGVDHTPGVWSNCRCYSIRAAILADREARKPGYDDIIQTRLRIEDECKALRAEVAFQRENNRNNVLAYSEELKELRAHADALAEALRGIVNEAGLEFSDPRVSYETWQLDPGAIERGRAALAAHDKLRGQ